MTFYIFNKDGMCVATSDLLPNEEDLQSREEYYEKDNIDYLVGYRYSEGVIVSTPVQQDYLKLARNLRDNIRSGIDTYLKPSSTISDQLVTEDQKVTLIQDSLALARWPAQEGWPYIDLPVLSDLCKSLLSIPDWEYPTQEVS